MYVCMFVYVYMYVCILYVFTFMGDPQVAWRLHVSVSKFVDFVGKWHPMVDNFLLTLLIFKVDFPLPTDASDISDCHNTELITVFHIN